MPLVIRSTLAKKAPLTSKWVDMRPAGNTISDIDAPPRMVTIRASDVTYNQDFVDHLVKQEQNRLAAAGSPLMSPAAVLAFRNDIARKVIIQGRPDLALTTQSNHQVLFEEQ